MTTEAMPATDIAHAVVGQLRTIIEHEITNDPRSLQTALGPSEIGNACDRCLIHMLAGTPQTPPPGVPWLPYIGRAVHEANEMAIVRHQLAELKAGISDMGEWITEHRVCVGDVNGQPIYGSADVFHVPTGTVVDFKIVGTTTLRKVRADCSGTSLTYKRQIQCYGKGFAAQGHTVRAVAIWYMPRNGMNLSQGRTYTAPYDEQIAVDALDRATRFAQWVHAFGADQVLAGAAPHTHDEFSCGNYSDAAPLAPGTTPSTFLGLSK